MFWKIIFILLVTMQSALASYRSAESTYLQKHKTTTNYTAIMKELVADGYHFSIVPLLKEYIALGKSREVESLIEKVVYSVGVKQFESLPISILRRSNSDALQFVVAKKLFRKKKFKASAKVLSRISSSHYLTPFVYHLQASIKSITKDYAGALSKYSKCISASNSEQGSDHSSVKNWQLEINRDYCIIGRARTYFASRKFEKSDLAYLDLPKSSYIWPEILFEEAWNSFYQGNYNRTLGKLVTYRSPFLSYVYNPEVDVLNAMTYLKMCLWNDAKTSSNEFYNKYMQPAREVRKILRSKKKNFKFFYNVAFEVSQEKKTQRNLLRKMLKSIVREPAYKEMIASLKRALKEHDRLAKENGSRFRRFMVSNLKETMRLQRDTVGAYVRKRLLVNYTQLFRAFQQMSYIKLEVLAHRKKQLYLDKGKSDRSRGDIQYVRRNDKQYFWTFNGAFWADELGDYVFALRSECK